MNEVPIEIIVVWIICILVIGVVTRTILKESKRSDEYFSTDERIIDDFYVMKK